MWISHSGPVEPSSHAKMQFSGAILLCFKTCHLHAMRIQNLERDDNVLRLRSFDHRCFAILFNNSIVRSFTVSIAFRSQCGGFFFNLLLCTRSKRWRIPFRRLFCRPETSIRIRTRSNRETSWFSRTNRLLLTWQGITKTTREKFKSKFGWMAAWSPCNNFLFSTAPIQFPPNNDDPPQTPQQLEQKNRVISHIIDKQALIPHPYAKLANNYRAQQLHRFTGKVSKILKPCTL